MRRLAMVVVGLVLLAGCSVSVGKDEDDSGSAGPTTTSTSAATTTTIGPAPRPEVVEAFAGFFSRCMVLNEDEYFAADYTVDQYCTCLAGGLVSVLPPAEVVALGDYILEGGILPEDRRYAWEHCLPL